MKLRKLKRDIVVSVVGSKDLVGVYFADTDGSEVLLECSPEKADMIISIWNDREFNSQCELCFETVNVKHPFLICDECLEEKENE
jgi:hypothetical protein